jgi:hypothetical protein
MERARVAAEAVLLLHVLWCAWVLLDWTVTRGRRVLRILHIASPAYAIVIEMASWPCPLTVTETQLEARAGIEPAHGPFLVHVLDAIVYPDLPEWLVVGVAVVVCVTMPGCLFGALSASPSVRLAPVLTANQVAFNEMGTPADGVVVPGEVGRLH